MKTQSHQSQPHFRIGRIALLIVCVLAFVLPVAARQGTPPRSAQQNVKALTAIQQLTLAATDVPAELARDAQKVVSNPLQFAVVRDVAVTPGTHGTWEQLPDGRLWRVRVVSSGSTDLNLGFTTFWLPEGATLHVIAESENYFEGPYTSEDNESHGQLWTPVVPGEAAVVEIFVPTGAVEPQISLSQVNTGYRDMFHKSPAKAGACNNDVICAVGDPWRAEMRSVARYTRSGAFLCTGTLIGNTANDFKNYFLTANHCGISAANAATLVVYWNYQSPTCGQHGGGSLAQNQTGAFFRSARADVDFALVELDDIPSPAFNVYYAGWDRSGTVPGGAVGIHHPNGDEKAITFSVTPLTTINSCIGSGGVNSHWHAVWSSGVTEPGSSGSAIWNPANRRVVGFLSGGASVCGGGDLSDCYGKTSVAWDGASAAVRLKDWLDPLNTGTPGIPGVDPGAPSTPSNDLCAGAIGLTNGVAFAMSIATATITSDPVPTCQPSFAHGVWFTYVSPANGIVTLSTCGSGFDTVLQAYSGSCAALTPVACNDDAGPVCPTVEASVTFASTAGTTYRILAGGFSANVGTLSILATFALVNDQCAGAIALTNGIPYLQNTAQATATGDPVPTCATMTKGVWFTFTPAANGVAMISTCGSDFDTLLQIYTGTCGALTAVAGQCVDDSGPACIYDLDSSVGFNATAGTTYRIFAGGLSSSSGNMTIVASVVTPRTLTVNSFPANGVTVYTWPPDAAGLSGDVNTAFARTYGDGSVAYLYAPSSDGFNVFSKWQLDGVNLTTSQDTLVTMGADHTATAIYVSPNDQCFGAIPLTNGLTFAMSTVAATETNDPLPSCAPIGKGVWFSYTPTTNQLVTLNSCGSSFDSLLQVYTGTCGALQRVGYGCDDDNGPACAGLNASVVFNGLAGTTYFILAGGFIGSSGNLQITATSSLVNDACAGALPLYFGAPFTMDNFGATSTGDPAATCTLYLSNGVWFTFTSPITGPVPVSTCGSSFDTVLQVFTNACGALAPMVCNDDFGPSCANANASLVINAVAGQTYRILAGGFFASRGTMTIMVGTPPVISAVRGASDVQLWWPYYYYPAYVLQWQSNILGVGMSSNWLDVLPNDTVRYFNPIPGTPPSFYRLTTP